MSAQDNFSTFSRLIADSFVDAKEIQREINEELLLDRLSAPVEVTGAIDYDFDQLDEEDIGFIVNQQLPVLQYDADFPPAPEEFNPYF